MNTLDILMVTHDQPDYLRLSLPRLLDSCDAGMRVWLWHNGNDAATLELSRSFADDHRVARFHHSPENVPLREATNWLFANSEAEFLAKVDDDCLVAPEWARTFIKAHRDYDGFGCIGSWRFLDEDFEPDLALRKIREFPGGHRLMVNMWVQGSGFVLKRACVERHGLIQPNQTFPKWVTKLSLAGWANGWYYPFVHEEDMDDPRSPNTRFRTDADVAARPPLTARYNGITTLAEWQDQIRRTAHADQAASIDHRYYRGWRPKVKHARQRVRALVTGDKRKW